ncbi:MAG: hypothetical protein ACOCWQ_00905 [Nanoarchaeota archaeon]
MKIPTKTVMMVYVVFWLFLSVVAVAVILMHNENVQDHECIDGSLVADPAECPICVNDSHCKMDTVCDEGICVSKQCIVDSDCQNVSNRCVYDRCQLG